MMRPLLSGVCRSPEEPDVHEEAADRPDSGCPLRGAKPRRDRGPAGGPECRGRRREGLFQGGGGEGDARRVSRGSRRGFRRPGAGTGSGPGDVGGPAGAAEPAVLVSGGGRRVAGRRSWLHHGSVGAATEGEDRKSTRLNSSHQIISYAVFCLKKKK